MISWHFQSRFIIQFSIYDISDTITYLVIIKWFYRGLDNFLTVLPTYLFISITYLDKTTLIMDWYCNSIQILIDFWCCTFYHIAHVNTEQNFQPNSISGILHYADQFHIKAKLTRNLNLN